MNDDKGFLGGINDLASELSSILIETSDERVNETLFKGAKMLAEDIRKLPSPRSKISKSGYTHILETIKAWNANGKVKVGWGKFYGPVLEHGSNKMGAQPHLKPTWEKNKIKYQEDMIRSLKLT